MLPVFKFNETPVGNGKFGKITKNLIDKWGKNVGVNIIQQIRDFGTECKNQNSDAPTPYQFSTDQKK